jgi:hypothetical protein
MALPASWATGSAITRTLASAATRTRSNSAFIRELWADEIIAAYKANLVMPQLVVAMNHVGKKGDTVHIPRPVRGSASAKAAEAQVTLIANQATSSVFQINSHFEYSTLIEDIVTLQADDGLRRFLTDDAGYALAKKVDTDLHAEGAKFAGADASPTVAGSAYSKAVVGTPSGGVLVVWDPTANTNTGNASILAEEGIRCAIQQLDDNDVPSRERYLVIPPVEKKNLLGIQRFTEQAFVGELGGSNSIRNGRVGDVYGVEVFVSTNAPTVEDTGMTADQRAVLMFQKEALLLIEQQTPRTQTQYKQEYLADLFTADVVYAPGLLRPEGGIAIVVPA